MLDIVGLTKQFRDLTAVWNLSLHLDQGDIFGFIGPNGAGKTTTIKMMATLLRPTAGTVYIDGHDICTEQETVRGLIGYMPDFFGVYDDIKVWEYLDFFAAAYRVPKADRPQIIEDVLGLTDLTGKRDTYVDELSRGMKQRLCLAKTLVHDPKVLLLDEPASGLDPRARIEIRELLKELRNLGKTIFVSSHILAELADFCTKIGIIENGQLIASGSVEDIMRRMQQFMMLKVKVLGGPERAELVLAGLPNISDIEREDDTLRMHYQGPPEALPQVLRALTDQGIPVMSFAEEELTLEDIFIRLTKGIVS